MFVKDLIELLQQFPATAKLRIAEQPTHPLEYKLSSAIFIDGECAVYLIEGKQQGCLSADAALAIGWSQE